MFVAFDLSLPPLLMSTIHFLTFACLGSLALVLGCATDFPGDPADLHTLEYPASLALHPSGNYLYVVNTNFDLKYRIQDGGSLSIIDLNTRRILDQKSLKIPSFGGEVILNPEGTRLFLAERGHHSLLWLDIEDQGASLVCPLSSSSEDLDPCRIDLADEPVALGFLHTERKLLGATRAEDILAIGHLSDGILTMVLMPEGNAQDFEKVEAKILNQPSDIVPIPNSDAFYITARSGEYIERVAPAVDEWGHLVGVLSEPALHIPTPYTGGAEGRALLLDQHAKALFLTNQTPHALLAYNLDQDEILGQEPYQMIDLPREPNRMVWLQDSKLLALTSLGENRLILVQTQGPVIVGHATVGRAPYDLVYNPKKSEIYVSNFREHSISVLDASDLLHPLEVDVIADEERLQTLMETRHIAQKGRR